MHEFIHTVIDFSALPAVAFFALAGFLSWQERKRFERARAFFEGTIQERQAMTADNLMQMCGGCGVIMPQSDLNKCDGENCANYKKGLERTLRV